MIRATLLQVGAAATDAGGTTPRRPAAQLQVARGRCPRRGPKPCLFWLHIQKTGTAFGATLAAAGCPEQPKQRNVRKWTGKCSYALGAGSHILSRCKDWCWLLSCGAVRSRPSCRGPKIGPSAMS